MKSEQWDIEVKAGTSKMSLQLRQLWQYRDLLLLFVKRDFTAQYKQTILGPLWFFMQPVLTAITFTIIFGNLAQLPTAGYPRLLFYLSGITCWGYFADCLNKTSGTFLTNAHIFSKVFFPRLIAPLSVVISNLVRFSIQLLLLAGFIVYYNITGLEVIPNAYILLLPVLVLIMAILGLGAGLFVSSITTKYRDLQFLVAFGVTLLMYFSPVIFPLATIKEGIIKTVVSLNPMTSIIETFRYAVLGSDMPFDLWGGLLYSTAFAVILLGIALVSFNRVQRTFMDTI
jgi:lipopolysaccharide transport system permease protein